MSFALFGYGYWGKILADVLRSHTKKLVIVDPHLSVSPQGFEHQSLESVLGDQEITHCFLASPEETHAQLSASCLKSGKHVFVEKPLALFTKEAVSLTKLAQKNQRILFTDYTFLYDPTVSLLVESIRCQEIGKLQRILSRRFSPGFIKPQITVTDDLAIHDIYLGQIFFGQPITRTHSFHIGSEKHECIESYVQYFFGQGRKMIGMYSWQEARAERTMIFYGEHGSIIWQRGKDTDSLIINTKNGIEKKEITKDHAALSISVQTFLNMTNPKSKAINAQLISQYQSYIRDIRVLESIREKSLPLSFAATSVPTPR